MAKAKTAKFEEYIVEVEFDPDSAAGVYSRVCAMNDYTTTRTNNMGTSEVPDCEDESKPHEIDREVVSQEVTVSGTGLWSLSSNDKMYRWWKSAKPLNTRIRNAFAEANAAAGEVFEETGPAILVTLANSRTKGQKVAASIDIQFNGVPVAGTVQAAP